jgi:cyclopropane-fatty-acyl-phospholipid synthase
VIPPGEIDTASLRRMRRILAHLAATLDAPVSVRLWDGKLYPLGSGAGSAVVVAIDDAGVVPSLLRWPTLENVLEQYALGRIHVDGGDLIELAELARSLGLSRKLRSLGKARLALLAAPLLLGASGGGAVAHAWRGKRTGQPGSRRRTRDLIQFHYDLGNDFYQLFLDPEMQYSCGYFEEWDRSLEEAQAAKLEMICRKLRLAPGDRFLDVGCGWGGLVCHAARRYGVTAHGVTLSQEQYDFATAKAARLGLADRVTIELRDYASLEGTWDKIASIGMYEHVGIANYPEYFGRIRSLLRERGMFLNHGITRRAKRSRRRFAQMNAEKRLILKYVFPGTELDHVGHTIESMEASGFEVHDVESWREHYALTCRHWHRRLMARRDEAIARVGAERFRMWGAYLAGVSLGFANGSLQIYQVVATRGRRGASGMPATRRHLYPAEGP